MELVSIIVPVFNVHQYLEKCLKSIVNQTYQNIEILVIDDGSTDGSENICDIFAQNYSNVTVYHKENRGLSSARNCGVEHASGEYYIFIDSDDYVDQNFVQTMMEKRDGADLVISNYCKVDIDGNHLKQDNKIQENNIWTQSKFWEHYYFNGLWITCEVTWNKLYNSHLFNKVRFPTGKLHEDEFVIGDIVKASRKIKVIDDVLYYYVQRSNSIMHKNYTGNLDLAEALLQRYNKFSTGNEEQLLMFNEATLCAASKSLMFGFFESGNKSRFKILRRKFNMYTQKQLHRKKSKKLSLERELIKFPRIYRLLYQVK